jgi:hypothetical protein
MDTIKLRGRIQGFQTVELITSSQGPFPPVEMDHWALPTGNSSLSMAVE